MLVFVLSGVAACSGSSGESVRSVTVADKRPTGLRVTAETDKRLVWSPYTWVTEGDAQMSPTVGAYVDVSFQGTTIGLEVDTAPLDKADAGLAYISVSAIIDGSEPQRITLDKVENGRLLWDGLEPGTHHVRLAIAKNQYSALRWNDARQASLYITGVVTDGPLIPPPATASNAPTALFYGDSVAEGNDVEGMGVLGDNSFAVVAMDKLGYRYALKTYSALTWQFAAIARAGTFVDIESSALQTHITWMNYFSGQSMMTDTSPPRFLEGSPDLILNNLGSVDTQAALESQGFGRPARDYLAPAITAWLTQVRAATGPDTVIAMIKPVVYDCPEVYDTDQREATRVLSEEYRRGIADYSEAHPDDKRVLTIDIGEPACKLLLGDTHSGPHVVPKTAEATGELLADALEKALVKLPE